MSKEYPAEYRNFVIATGVRQDMAHAGGRSHAEERLCEAAAMFRINRRRKAMYGGLFRKLN
jgi:hypothetical protein